MSSRSFSSAGRGRAPLAVSCRFVPPIAGRSRRDGVPPIRFPARTECSRAVMRAQDRGGMPWFSCPWRRSLTLGTPTPADSVVWTSCWRLSIAVDGERGVATNSDAPPRTFRRRTQAIVPDRTETTGDWKVIQDWRVAEVPVEHGLPSVLRMVFHRWTGSLTREEEIFSSWSVGRTRTPPLVSGRSEPAHLPCGFAAINAAQRPRASLRIDAELVDKS